MLRWMPDKDFGRFPPEYLDEAVCYLTEFEVLTYDDLDWDDDNDYVHGFPREYDNWKLFREPEKVYVILQHDVDMFPERTLRVLELEADLGVKSNVMLFRDYHDRASLQIKGELVFEEYLTDAVIKGFQRFEKLGFVIGYHCNTYEQSGFDVGRAQDKAEGDVEYLRQFFRIKYYSPHGGVRDSNDKSNYILTPPAGLRWVNNYHGITCDGFYSDSLLFRENIRPKDYLETCEPGKRYQVLTHPQHYHEVYESWK